MSSPFLFSEFAHDPDMHDILVEFCQRLPDTICRLQQAFELRDLPAIQRIAHQMKGSGAGYGFESLSRIGAELESAAKLGEWTPTLHERADEFIRQCRLARPNPVSTVEVAP